MTWDKNNPPGNTKISIGDNSIRDNNAQIETAVDQEHAFATGSTQTGRHSFDIDTEANRALASPSYENGGIFLATDVRTGKLVLQAKDGGTFENVDVEPGGATPTLPRLDSQSKFITCQFATWEEITPAAGTPMTLAVDFQNSPLQYASISADTLIQNPIGNLPLPNGTIVTFDLIMDPAGGHQITWGSDYRAVGSFVSIDTSSGGRTLLTFVYNAEGKTIVSALPGWNNGTVTS